MIKKQIAENAEMMIEDFEYAPFNQQGGVFWAKQLFGDRLDNVVNELNGYLIAWQVKMVKKKAGLKFFWKTVSQFWTPREYLLMQERELKELKVKVEASSILIMEQLEK